MTNLGFRSTVSSQEAEALKEMIFKRIRERAQALNENIQNNFTTTLQNEIMDLARNSLVSSKNPFIIKEEQENIKEISNSKEVNSKEIETAHERIKEIKSQLQESNKILNKDLADKTIEATMFDIRNNFKQNQGFTGALNFLNSQASIALIKNKGTSFEAIA